jgi:hypothetical protein
MFPLVFGAWTVRFSDHSRSSAGTSRASAAMRSKVVQRAREPFIRLKILCYGNHRWRHADQQNEC